MAPNAPDDTAPAKPLSDTVVIEPASAGDEHHGIPTAVFFDDIAKVVDEHTAPALIDKLSALSQKYRYFEERLVKGKATLEEKIVEVKRAISAVSALQKRAKDTKTHFELSDGIYVEATIPKSDTVCLWLGANVMVEYAHAEALQLLDKNLESAQKSFNQTSEDITFLRNQLNTTDVNLSRVYNHHVKSVRSLSTNPNAATRQTQPSAVTSVK